MPRGGLQRTLHGLPSRHATGDHLDTPVREIMTPGVVTISEDASLHQAYRALVEHAVHAVLVVGRTTGRPLGWVTARGLLSWVTSDDSLVCLRDAVTEPIVTIEPGASVREALRALSQAGTTHLLVAHREDVAPEGVLSDLDLVGLASR